MTEDEEEIDTLCNILDCWSYLQDLMNLNDIYDKKLKPLIIKIMAINNVDRFVHRGTLYELLSDGELEMSECAYSENIKTEVKS